MAKNRQKEPCIICGCTINKSLTRHHVIPRIFLRVIFGFIKDDKIAGKDIVNFCQDNTISLCQSCHNRVEQRKRPYLDKVIQRYAPSYRSKDWQSYAQVRALAKRIRTSNNPKYKDKLDKKLGFEASEEIIDIYSESPSPTDIYAHKVINNVFNNDKWGEFIGGWKLHWNAAKRYAAKFAQREKSKREKSEEKLKAFVGPTDIRRVGKKYKSKKYWTKEQKAAHKRREKRRIARRKAEKQAAQLSVD